MSETAAPAIRTVSPPSTRTPAAKLRVRGGGVGGRLRKLLFWTHLVVALVVGIVVMVMSVTGVAIAYQRQVTAGALKSHAAPPPRGLPRMPVDQLLARAAAAQGGTPVSFTEYADPSMPLGVTFEGRKTVAVNPYTGDAARVQPPMQGFFSLMERLHRSMAVTGSMRNPLGTKITGASNLAFLFLILSGLFLWMPRRWSKHAVKVVSVPRFRADGRARDWNWHHVAGLWFAPFLIVIVASGSFMSYQWPTALVAKLAGDPPPAQGGEGGPRGGGEARSARGEGRGGAEGRGGGEGRGPEGRRGEGRAGDGRGGEARRGDGFGGEGQRGERGMRGEGRGRPGGEGRVRDRGEAGVRAGGEARGEGGFARREGGEGRRGEGGEGRRGGREGGATGEAPKVAWATLLPAAERQSPGWSMIQARLPREAGDPVNFTVTRGGGTRPDQRAQLTLDATTGAVKEMKAYGDNPFSRRARMWVRPLHTGEGFGLVGQTIAALASAAGALLVWTGFALAWRRWRAWMKRRIRPVTSA